MTQYLHFYLFIIMSLFQFNPASAVTTKHTDYHALPKDKDCIHVVAMVVDATTVASMSTKLLEKLHQIKTHASDRGTYEFMFIS